MIETSSDPVAESALIGSIMLDPSIADEVSTVISPEDFADPEKATIYRAQLALIASGAKPDAVMLPKALKKSGDWGDDKVNAAMIAECVMSVGHAGNAVYYAKTIREWAVRKSMKTIGSIMARDAMDATKDASELLSAAESNIFALSEGTLSTESKPVSDVVMEVMQLLERRRGGSTDFGVSTGYSDIDNITGGLRNGELIVVAARPGIGKSAFALCVARHVSLKCEEPVLYLSLEMSRLELGERLVSGEARVDSRSIRNNFLSQRDCEDLVSAQSRLQQCPLYVHDESMLTVAHVGSLARRLKRKRGLKLIVLDYLQLLTPDDRKAPRQEQVACMTRRLKGLARELNVPILCLCQLNREVEKGTDMRPRLCHLRESGAIEQDADVVMMLHRQRGKEDQGPMNTEVLIAKNRNGRVGDALLSWLPHFVCFEAAARPDQTQRYSEFDAYRDSSGDF